MLQLVYRIQIKQPNLLLVQLEEKGTKRTLYLDQLKAAAQPADRDVLSFLIPIHLRSPNVSRQLDTASFRQIEVSAAQSNQAMELMVKTGRLFFNNIAISFHSIACPITWKGEKHSESSCTIEAWLEGLPLSSADLIFPGNPYWFLHKGVFRPLSTPIPWIWIERFAKGPLLLEGAQQKKFFEEDPVILWNVQQKEEKSLEVFPQLVLQDVTGCFAHLWMDYLSLGKIAFEDLNPMIQGKRRLKEAEAQWEKDLLETGFIQKIVGATRYFCPSDQAASALCFLLELGWKILDSKGRSVFRQTGFHVSMQEKSQHIAVSGILQFQGQTAPLFKQSGRLWMELDAHSVGLIDHQALEPVTALMQEGRLENDELYLPRQKLFLLSSWLDSPQTDWAEELKKTVSHMTLGIEDSPPSSSFKGALLPYQQKGVDWLSHLHRCGFSGLLADEMGLGKTVQVLAFFSRLRTNLPILIVAPTSLLLNWSRECAKFLPSLSVYIHSGKDRLQDRLELQRLPLIITSYALLRLDESLFSQMHFEAIVLDESQAIKNKQTQTAESASTLKGNFRLCLSGTPIENRTEEFVSQFHFLLPDLLSVTDSVEQLKRKSLPFFLRRRKSEVDLELPEKREQTLWVEMTDAQEQIYLAYQAQLKKGLFRKIEQDGASTHHLEILEAILRLRQICCDPRLLGESFLGAKVEQLKVDLAEMVAGHRKILIYSQFTQLLSLLKNELALYQPLYLDGSMGYEERGQQVQQFQEDPQSLVFLLSLKAGGAGLNLTAADTVLLFDPWWNEAVEQQAIDRAHRMGQTKKILAKRYLTPNSIEEKMLSLKQKKQAVADQLLSSSEEAFNWTSEDLLHLLF
jgi:superfamily II DNA or RNA helicase